MLWTDRYRTINTVIVIAALITAAASLVVSHLLTRDLAREEVRKVEVWAEAMRSLIAADENTDLNLVLKVVNSNTTIPIVVLDGQNEILASRNIKPSLGTDSLTFIREQAREMRQSGHAMQMNLSQAGGGEADTIYICYGESSLLKRLAVYPYVQLGVAALFLLLVVFALSAFKRAEQNRVWVGLSRETAHQLGTPISSLMAWSEVLKESHPDDPLLPEMDKDIGRLQLIAERFSKIGSEPELHVADLRPLVARAVDYMARRTPHNVTITARTAAHPLPVRVNEPLFEWVIENLCKNAVDAMPQGGSITLTLSAVSTGTLLEVTDTGKGIPKKHFKSVFKPGFTTKKRGWGLGLSLAKRIVEKYHNGRIYVKSSEVGKGTTFAIEMS